MTMTSRSNDENKYGLITDKTGRVFSLFVRQPFASALCEGLKSVEIRSKWTAVRGNILICSTALHDYRNAQGGSTIGIAELYDIKPVGELNDEQWAMTRVTDREKVKGGWAWLLRNQRRVIEFPVHSHNKISYIDIILDDITTYPTVVIYDKDVN